LDDSPNKTAFLSEMCTSGFQTIDLISLAEYEIAEQVGETHRVPQSDNA
jgi:hypothetical protein